MAQYHYKVMDKGGKNKKGTVEAMNLDKAKEKLKGEGYTIQSISEQGGGKTDLFQKKVKSRDLAIFCKQFVAVLNAGVTIISALEMMAEQMSNKTLQSAIRETQAYVQKGGNLADGFKLNPKVFPPILINMVAAGEMSGNLEISFERLTTHFEKSDRLGTKVKGAMVYPAVILVVVIAVVILMLVKVVPQFTGMFEELGAELPGPTKMLVATSKFLRSYGLFVVIGFVALVYALKAYGKTEAGSHLYANISLKAPVFGNLTIKLAASTFARTLSTLMASGIPLMDAIEQVARMMKNKIIREGLMDARNQVAKGIPLSKPLRDMNIFPNMLPQMTKIGEETGNIEDMMDKVAEYYEGEVEAATDAMTAMLEPMIIVLMSVVVGGIVIAIMAPMLGMYEAIENY